MKDYIANCIGRIINAKCADKNVWQRDQDIAEAVRIAAREGVDVAHNYLIDICDKAEAGGYAD